jgi:hypothetical protein
VEVTCGLRVACWLVVVVVEMADEQRQRLRRRGLPVGQWVRGDEGGGSKAWQRVMAGMVYSLRPVKSVHFDFFQSIYLKFD